MIAGVIAMIASVVRWGAIFGGGSDREEGGAGGAIAAIVLAIVAPIAATIIQLAVSRQREYGADATGAALSGDPLALAGALAKLQRGNQAIPMHADGDNPAIASLARPQRMPPSSQ